MWRQRTFSILHWCENKLHIYSCIPCYVYYVLCIVLRICIEYLYKIWIFQIIKALSMFSKTVTDKSGIWAWLYCLQTPKTNKQKKNPHGENIYKRRGDISKQKAAYGTLEKTAMESILAKWTRKKIQVEKTQHQAHLISNRNIRSVRVNWIWNLKIIEIFSKVRIASCFILFFLILWIFHVLVEWINRLGVFHWNIRHIL